MSPGPLRRLAGGVGLAALAPTSYMLVVGQVSPADAAVRAGATLLGVMVIARLVRWCLSALAADFERADTAREPRSEGTGQLDGHPPPVGGAA